MEKQPQRKTNNMVYSPDYHIPLGQAVRTPNGEYGLRVKKDKSTYEVIPIGKLMPMIIQAADTKTHTSSDPE